MRISKVLRTATLAVSLVTVAAGMSAAFADTNSAAQPQQQSVNSGIYDSPNFIVPAVDIH